MGGTDLNECGLGGEEWTCSIGHGGCREGHFSRTVISWSMSLEDNERKGWEETDRLHDLVRARRARK